MPFSYFFETFSFIELNSGTIFWNVNVSDSFGIASSNNGPFSIFVDINQMNNININNTNPEKFTVNQNYPNLLTPILK